MAPPPRLPAAPAAVLCGWAFLLALSQPVHASLHDGLQLDEGVGEDHMALLQHRAQPRRQRSSAIAHFSSLSQLKGHVGNLYQTLGDARQSPGSNVTTEDIFCYMYPGYCKAPFSCPEFARNEAHEKFNEWIVNGLAPGGIPDLHVWCYSEESYQYISRCATGDLIGAAKIRYLLTRAGYFGGLAHETDGSLCFLEGYCADTDVSENTTLGEAMQLCDERYGHEDWIHSGSLFSPAENAVGYAQEETWRDPRNGYANRSQTRPLGLAACARGCYHCDVMYCRENYCKDEYYIKKYGHFLKGATWVK
eukprot:CAMPEP_0175710406 /NCGR_PEP_ID=MMETSP0097-20121207/40066_1 /TAXON_ID=311494 /ORGANISM="Alexandrium monilatum, Strain CCMP3105" /LENGTH=305 /DNA_ID=CAMNT_0017017825 /DNA_START=44 /DNA_END=961 /DNA_ORIENTATION=+